MEDSAWSRTVKLRTKDVNLFRRLRTSRLLEMLQEASIAHTEELGWTRETTLDRGFLWVVAMQQLQVIRMPEYDETVTLRSWPGPMMHVLYPRQYLLEDEEGNALVRGSAIPSFPRRDGGRRPNGTGAKEGMDHGTHVAHT